MADQTIPLISIVCAIQSVAPRQIKKIGFDEIIGLSSGFIFVNAIYSSRQTNGFVGYWFLLFLVFLISSFKIIVTRVAQSVPEQNSQVCEKTIDVNFINR